MLLLVRKGETAEATMQLTRNVETAHRAHWTAGRLQLLPRLCRRRTRRRPSSIRYESVRDPQHRAKVALLDPAVLTAAQKFTEASACGS